MLKIQYLYDLHIHTSPYSMCSTLSFSGVYTHISERLDGFAITDHEYIPPVRKTKQQQQFILDKLEMNLLYGVEMSTPDGDLLIFGISEPLSVGLSIKKVIRAVHDLGGVVIAAHPWRYPGFPGGGIGDKVYDHDIDALEINGLTSKGHNKLASAVAKEINIPTIGGSDAHSISGLNKAATVVTEPLSNVFDLIKAIQIKKTKGIIL